MSKVKTLLLALSVMGLLACSEPPPPKAIIKTVFATSPETANQSATRTLSGVLQPVDQSVLSFEIPGVIDKVNVNLGDKFNQGDVLASIEDKVMRLSVQQSEGQLSEAKARLTEAELDFNRKKQLVASGAVSKAEVDVAEARFQSLVDQVNIARTQVSIAKEDLADTQLIAPFSGSVAQRHVEPSQQVSPSTAILTIQGSDALEVAIYVPESLITKIHPGDQVSVHIVNDIQSKSLTGEVFEQGSQAQRANAFPVTIKLDETEDLQGIQPGMSAEVTFSISDNNIPADAYSLPLSAIGSGENNSHYVFAIQSVAENSKLVQVPIKVQSFKKDKVIFTTNHSLDVVVLNGVDFLRDGQQIKVADHFPQMINQ
ncbi:efflux RND transporter periplasmic adaptor subunit [Glaciecola sp. 1036]|uniref:efflux RND transporter periplasmic adaptor subunit n=1 Tax=Alteromonadaceae TaxID=72275 RepID=UPI003CFF7732